MICEETQIRLTQAGFRLLRRATGEDCYVIRYRDLDVITPSQWRTLASYKTKTERDEAFARIVNSDFWSIDVNNYSHDKR
ncbi:MAG: hypothetical protein IJL31_00235 [Oscillospiraceae bacterium]|nr:hypothetical protein [Bacillota bacterium]MBQ6029874.1 hypothetical protein [Oscillospiraceae bacterium]MBQ6029915.1 hypothetical protein [Oscillospiraceae bacterium]MBQ6243216.1 hypothetical protein [Bacteroidales bacterium]